MSRVIVIGSINNDIVVTTDRHPKVGETIFGKDLKTFPGGKGANQAVGAARAGADTQMIGLVGEDSAGMDLKEFLDSAGVGVDQVRADPTAPTGTALINVASGDNTIVVVPGANSALDIREFSFLGLSGSDVALAQFETPTGPTTSLFLEARKAGARTLLNPAPAMEVPNELLEVTDYLIVNEHEYELIFGDLPTPSSRRPNAAGFSGKVVATLGREGVLAWLSDSDVPVRTPGEVVDAIDSTGAGDCFCGYLAAGLAEGLTEQAAIDRANRAAALSVTMEGAAASIPWAKDVS